MNNNLLVTEAVIYLYIYNNEHHLTNVGCQQSDREATRPGFLESSKLCPLFDEMVDYI